jgi:phospholipid/cholesterol/gamma-HCH transport system substrate-binding protein
MKRNIIETIFGGVVLIIAVIFVIFVYSSSNVKKVDGYQVIAKFSNINGVNIGSDVTIGGYKVGSVSDVEIEEDFFIKTTLNISNTLKGKIPYDSIAMISSPSIMSDKVVSIETGIEEEYLANGEELTNTQSGVSLEQLIGQVIFSLKGSKDSDEDDS